LYDLREHLAKLCDALGQLLRGGSAPSWLLIAVKGSYSELGHLALGATHATPEIGAAIARAETLLELCGVTPPTGPTRVLDESAQPRAPAAGSTILIVEDDPDLQFTLRGVLEERGYRVVTAGHGADALSLLDEVAPSMVVVDLSTPVADGWELIERMKSHRAWRAIPICVISAHARLHEPKHIVAALRKPIDPALLLETVGRFALPKAGVG